MASFCPLREGIRRGIRVDFNQGLDARLVDKDNAPLLAKLKWINYIRFSCDTPETRCAVENAVTLLRKNGYAGHPFVYVLVTDVSTANATCEFLRLLGCDPFAQAYQDYTGEDKRTHEQKRFCRFVNNKAVFKSCKWKDYK